MCPVCLRVLGSFRSRIAQKQNVFIGFPESALFFTCLATIQAWNSGKNDFHRIPQECPAFLHVLRTGGKQNMYFCSQPSKEAQKRSLGAFFPERAGAQGSRLGLSSGEAFLPRPYSRAWADFFY